MGSAIKRVANYAISDTAFGTSWNGVTDVAPSKNAVYDEMELRAPKASPTFTGLITSAGQIKFPATQYPSSDVNTLDDYEEGSSSGSPTATFGTLTTASYSLNYVKIGRQVSFNGIIAITDKGTGSGGLVVPLPINNATVGTSLWMDVSGVTGVSGAGYVSGNNVVLFKVDFTTIIIDGVYIYISGNYFA